MFQMFSTVFTRLRAPIKFHEWDSPRVQRDSAEIKYKLTDKQGEVFIVTCKLTAVNVEKESEART